MQKPQMIPALSEFDVAPECRRAVEEAVRREPEIHYLESGIVFIGYTLLLAFILWASMAHIHYPTLAFLVLMLVLLWNLRSMSLRVRTNEIKRIATTGLVIRTKVGSVRKVRRFRFKIGLHTYNQRLKYETTIVCQALDANFRSIMVKLNYDIEDQINVGDEILYFWSDEAHGPPLIYRKSYLCLIENRAEPSRFADDAKDLYERLPPLALPFAHPRFI